jgi:hypothetical protein
MKLVINEEMVHGAVDYIAYQGHTAAAAKGNQVRAEYHRRRVRAQIILSAPHSSQGMREAYADAHDDYAKACENLAVCEEEVERHRNQRSKAETICEMWRTEQATIRGLRKVA